MPLLKRKSTVKQFEYQGMLVNVYFKKIKRMYLRIQPLNGKIILSCPLLTPKMQLIKFIHTHLAWIQKTQHKLKQSYCCNTEDFSSGSHHLVAGSVFQLQTILSKTIDINTTQDILEIASPSPFCNKNNQTLLDQWHRHQLNKIIPLLIHKWEPLIKRKVLQWRVKKMKTRWGTCNPAAQRIWLNLELAKTPLDCLEYVVVHEMVHLIERSHNAVFHAYMDTFLPDWRARKALLSRFLIG